MCAFLPLNSTHFGIAVKFHALEMSFSQRFYGILFCRINSLCCFSCRMYIVFLSLLLLIILYLNKLLHLIVILYENIIIFFNIVNKDQLKRSKHISIESSVFKYSYFTRTRPKSSCIELILRFFFASLI